jgi:hypothetical protein
LSVTNNTPLYQEINALPTKKEAYAATEELSTRWKIPKLSLTALVTNMGRYPSYFEKLVNTGLNDTNIAPWIMRPQGFDTPYNTYEPKKRKRRKKKVETTEKPPTETEKTEKTEKGEDEKKELPTYYIRKEYPTEKNPPDPNNKDLQEGVKHNNSPQNNPPRVIVNQPLGQYIQQQVDPSIIAQAYANNPELSGAFRTPDGKWLRPEAQDDGTTVYVEVPPPESRDDTYFSQLAFQTMRVNMMAIARKISMNPSVLQAYSYCIAQGYLSNESDLGDFINKAVTYMMQSMFGVKFGVIKIGMGQADRLEQMTQAYRNLQGGGDLG